MSAIQFEANISEINSWLVLVLPQEASSKLPSRGQVMVKGTINGREFIDALEPDGKGGHWLHLDTKLQKLVSAKAGETLKLSIESTKDWPEPTIPADVVKGLVTNPETKELWKVVTPMARWEWLRWIGSTKVAATRQKRIEVSASKLKNGLRRPCCFNRSMCCVPDVSKNGVLIDTSAPR